MRKLRFVGHIPSIGEWSVAYRVSFFLGGGCGLKGKNHLVDPVVNGKKILSWNLRNWGWGHGQD